MSRIIGSPKNAAVVQPMLYSSNNSSTSNNQNVQFNRCSNVESGNQDQSVGIRTTYRNIVIKITAICGSLLLAFTTILVVLIKQIFDREFISQSAEQIQLMINNELQTLIKLQETNVYVNNTSELENMIH
jgi:hypothetical protein